MRASEKRFERDRNHLVTLLVELLDRIEKAVDHGQLIELCPIFAEIEDLELAERCGLPACPFACVRTKVKGREVECYRWFDPYNGEKPEFVMRSLGQALDVREEERLERQARRDLQPAVDLWFRTVTDLSSPEAETDVPIPGRDPVLFRDRLWRALAAALSVHSTHSADLNVLWAGSAGLPPFMRKLNAMARYEKTSTDPLFRLQSRSPSKDGVLTLEALRAFTPTYLAIEFQAGTPPSAASCEHLSKLLSEWLAVRAGELRPSPAAASKAPPQDCRDNHGAHEVSPESSEVESLYDRLVKEGNTHRRNNLKPVHRIALEGFQLACERNPKLVRHQVTRDHHAWLQAHSTDLLPGRAKENVDTWMTYVRQGALTLFGPARKAAVPTRSIVEAPQADFGRTPRE